MTAQLKQKKFCPITISFSSFPFVTHRLGLPKCALILLLFVCSVLAAPAQTSKQKAFLEEMLQIFPKSDPWELWLKQTGSLPPNFDALPSMPYLPDPFRFAGGKEVKSREDWPRRRSALLTTFQQYV